MTDDPRVVFRPAPHTWDERPPTLPPLSFGRSWEMSKRATDFATYKGHPHPITQVFVRTVLAKEKVPIPLALPDGSAPSSSPTVLDVKRAFIDKMIISSRKHVTLRWLGSELPDESRTLHSLKVPEGTVFDAAIRKRTPAELEPLKVITHVLVCDLAGNACDVQVTGKTLVSELKALCKQPETSNLHFSPTFTSSFGTPLENERTLASYGILDGDILLTGISSSGADAPADAGAKAPEKGGKKGK